MKKIGRGKVTLWQLGSILRTIYKTPGITRAQISGRLGFDKSVTTRVTSFLEETGWINARDSQVKNVPIAIHPEKLTIAGVNIQPEFSTLVVCNLSGAILYETTWTEDRFDLECMLNIILPYRIHESGFSPDALGIALPGIVDEENETLIASNPLGIETVTRLPSRISAKNYPVFYCNDAHSIGWGQIGFNQEKGEFFLHYLDFIDHDPPTTEFKRIIHGSALFCQGTSFTGTHHCAGEIRIKSHLAFAGSGETYIDHATRLQMKFRPEIQEKYMESLAFTIAYAATLMDIPKVFLFGTLEKYSTSITKRIAELAQEISYYPSIQHITVEYPGFSAQTIPLGAAAMAVERLFTAPDPNHPGAFYRSIAEAGE